MEVLDQFLPLSFGDFGEKVGDQVFLAALPEDHPINGQGVTQFVQPLDFAAEGQTRNMAFDFRVAGKAATAGSRTRSTPATSSSAPSRATGFTQRKATSSKRPTFTSIS